VAFFVSPATGLPGPFKRAAILVIRVVVASFGAGATSDHEA
jgi:hypothetical protein